MMAFHRVFCNLHVGTLKVFEKKIIFGKCFKRKFTLHYLAVQDKYFRQQGIWMIVYLTIIGGRS